MIPKDFSDALDAGNQAIIILKNPKTNEAQVRMPSSMSLYEAYGLVEHIARRINLELMHVSDGLKDEPVPTPPDSGHPDQMRMFP